MESLLESVPNFSEGTSRETLEALAAAIRSHGGVWLLDRTADPDHQRSVFTLAGYPGRVDDGRGARCRGGHRAHRHAHATRAATRASALSTSSPSCPSVTPPWRSASRAPGPSRRTSPSDSSCPSSSTREAALRPDRRLLAGIRRPGFEGLADALSRPCRRARLRACPAPSDRRARPSWAPVRSSSPGTSSSPRPTSPSPGGWRRACASAMAACRRCRRWASTLPPRVACSSP